MTYQVSMSDVTQYFHRAHEALIKKLGGADLIVRKADFLKIHHLKILEQEWQKNYGIQIIEVNNSWKFLEFPDEKHYTMFILKWST